MAQRRPAQYQDDQYQGDAPAPQQQYDEQRPRSSHESTTFIPIIRFDKEQGSDGSYKAAWVMNEFCILTIINSFIKRKYQISIIETKIIMYKNAVTISTCVVESALKNVISDTEGVFHIRRKYFKKQFHLLPWATNDNQIKHFSISLVLFL